MVVDFRTSFLFRAYVAASLKWLIKFVATIATLAHTLHRWRHGFCEHWIERDRQTCSSWRKRGEEWRKGSERAVRRAPIQPTRSAQCPARRAAWQTLVRSRQNERRWRRRYPRQRYAQCSISKETAKKVHSNVQRASLPVGPQLPGIQTENEAARSYNAAHRIGSATRPNRDARTRSEKDRELACLCAKGTQEGSR